MKGWDGKQTVGNPIICNVRSLHGLLARLCTGSWRGRSFQWQDKITFQYSVPVVERCPAEEKRSRQCPFSSNLLLSSWPKGFPVLLLPKQQGRALVLQVFFLPGCSLSMDKLASLSFILCCLHPALGRQLGLLKSQWSGWRKSPRCGCSGLCREKDLALKYLLTEKMSKLEDSLSPHSGRPGRARLWQDFGL